MALMDLIVVLVNLVTLTYFDTFDNIHVIDNFYDFQWPGFDSMTLISILMTDDYEF